MSEPIFITGCPRSGVEIVAAIVNLCGAFGGNIPVYSQDMQNKEWAYENYEVRQDIIKPYLRSLKVDPLGLNPIPDLSNPELMRRMIVDGHKWMGRKVTGAMKRQGYKDGSWFYKGINMALIWPLWHTAFPKAKWIVVRRDTDAIAQSCMKTGYMKAYKTLEGWKWWVQAHEVRFIEMKRQGLICWEVWPSKMINENQYTEMADVINAVGLEWHDDSARHLVNSIFKKEVTV